MIQPTSNFLGFNRTDAPASSTSKPSFQTPPPAEKSEALASTQTKVLREALANSPEIRPEVVKKGHSLAVDPNYPPRELILRLARLMSETADPSEQA